ncbi:MAG: formylglycine-generating enzyme family protein [Gammaproteobacteria bacterium]|nr:MAG: formylglycine-generating enzyme family protein [Gammaproteobacteria bacterium]
MNSGRQSGVALLAILGLAVTGTAWSASAETLATTQLPSGAIIQDCADCPEVVVIPPGEFRMGYDGGEEGRYEGPERDVTIGYAFALGRYAITNAQYARFIEHSGHPTSTGCNTWDASSGQLGRQPDSSWRDPGHGRPIRDDEPVVCISWLDAQAYVQWLSETTGQHYRLPTEAEWEYVARNRTTTKFPWGDDTASACDHANVPGTRTAEAWGLAWSHFDCEDRFVGLAPVGAFSPNSFGVYDIIGNAWEWVEDCYLVPYPDTPVDGSAALAAGDCDRRSVRGGSWITAPFRQRPSWRGRDPEPHLSFIFGVRIVRVLQ